MVKKQNAIIVPVTCSGIIKPVKPKIVAKNAIQGLKKYRAAQYAKKAANAAKNVTKMRR